MRMRFSALLFSARTRRPVFVRLESVRVRKRLDLRGAIDTAVARLPVFWADKMNLELRKVFEG
jgi:hypothetical protein